MMLLEVSFSSRFVRMLVEMPSHALSMSLNSCLLMNMRSRMTSSVQWSPTTSSADARGQGERSWCCFLIAIYNR